MTSNKISQSKLIEAVHIKLKIHLLQVQVKVQEGGRCTWQRTTSTLTPPQPLQLLNVKDQVCIHLYLQKLNKKRITRAIKLIQ